MIELGPGEFLIVLLSSIFILYPIGLKIVKNDQKKGISFGRSCFKVAMIIWIYISILILAAAPLTIQIKILCIGMGFVSCNMYALIGYLGDKNK